MASQPSTSARASGNRRALIVCGVIGLGVIAAVGAWVYLWTSGHDMTGLEGTWRDKTNATHTYEFRPGGELAAWVGSKSWWNRLGWSATWRRDGQRITIRTDRNWDFEGQLDGGAIRGKMLIRNEAGAIESVVDIVWQKQ